MAHLPDGTHARSLCRVHWRLGQALLPEHFERQERGLARELELRFAQLAPPVWGIAQIEWDEGALARGTVHLTRLVAVLPRGRLVDLPGNARVASLELSTARPRGAPLELSTGKAEVVELYAHLLREHEYQKDDAGARDLDAVELAVQRVELSTEPGRSDAVDSLKLAELEQAPDGVWKIRPEYVPPLVAVAAWPMFLARVGGRLREVLARWKAILRGDVKSDVLSVAKRLRAGECLRRGHLLGWFLTQLGAGAPEQDGGPGPAGGVIAAHPFELFRCLMELYLDVHAYQSAAGDEPELVRRVYDHRNPARCFEPLLADLERRTGLPHDREPDHVRFVHAGRRASCELPRALERVRLYWVVHRGEGVGADGLRAVKLAAPGQLETVHRLSLHGVAVKPLASVPFRHDFDPKLDFYELAAEGEEWDHARREGKLAYVAEGPIAACETYLFWRAV